MKSFLLPITYISASAYLDGAFIMAGNVRLQTSGGCLEACCLPRFMKATRRTARMLQNREVLRLQLTAVDFKFEFN